MSSTSGTQLQLERRAVRGERRELDRLVVLELVVPAVLRKRRPPVGTRDRGREARATSGTCRVGMSRHVRMGEPKMRKPDATLAEVSRQAEAVRASTHDGHLDRSAVTIPRSEGPSSRVLLMDIMLRSRPFACWTTSSSRSASAGRKSPSSMTSNCVDRRRKSPKKATRARPRRRNVRLALAAEHGSQVPDVAWQPAQPSSDLVAADLLQGLPELPVGEQLREVHTRRDGERDRAAHPWIDLHQDGLTVAVPAELDHRAAFEVHSRGRGPLRPRRCPVGVAIVSQSTEPPPRTGHSRWDTWARRAHIRPSAKNRLTASRRPGIHSCRTAPTSCRQDHGEPPLGVLVGHDRFRRQSDADAV